MSEERVRKFKLPDRFNKDQDRVNDLPLEGRFLVIGAPGTGKSVVALLRVRKAVEANKRYRFLVFNHLLEASAMQLVGSDIQLVSSTWMRWIRERLQQYLEINLPTKAGSKDLDWNQIRVDLKARKKNKRDPFNESHYLIIDEGQDMPKEFYFVVSSLGVKNFFVVADQNQAINKNNSSLQELKYLLIENKEQVMELTENFRNSHQITKLAQHFHVDRASDRSIIPDRWARIPPILYTYKKDSFEDKVIKMILRRYDRDPKLLIGVITPNKKVQDKYFKTLESVSREMDRDNCDPIIQYYRGDHRSEIDFSTGGILVVNAQACKGLEFDIVYLADIDQHIIRDDIKEEKQKLFYVMISRAKEEVIMFKQCEIDCPELENLLPENEEILEREEL
tara:strand:- start:850 stop:2028 length:1179 start_codon:yes stop_codon:yes gene_type:complete